MGKRFQVKEILNVINMVFIVYEKNNRNIPYPLETISWIFVKKADAK